MKRIFSCLCVALVAAATYAQVGGPPPAIAGPLKKLEPFIGEYAADAKWLGEPYKGKAVIQWAVEGWFVQVQFLLEDSKGQKRENRWMITYDDKESKFRICRFETSRLLPSPEGVLRFEGDDLITEWDFINRQGTKGTYQNVLRLKGDHHNLYTKSQFLAPGKAPFVINETDFPREK